MEVSASNERTNNENCVQCQMKLQFLKMIGKTITVETRKQLELAHLTHVSKEKMQGSSIGIDRR